MNIRGLFLDFGSVVMKSFFETRRETERELGLQPGILTWSGPFDPDSDPLWQRMLAGEISERDYWNIRAREVGAILGRDWTIQEFCLQQNKIPLDDMLRSDALDLAADARRKGYKIGILSNELELFHGREWMDSIPLLKDVDCLYDATHTGILKPDPRAYEIALAGLGLPAHAVVFIDDQILNVRGGIDAGLHSIHLDILDPEAAFEEARRLLDLR